MKRSSSSTRQTLSSDRNKKAKKDTDTSPLYFYSTRPGKIGATYSNFSNHPLFTEDGNVYRTAEHYFQSKKFEKTDPKWAKAIRNCKTPSAAKKLGGNREHSLVEDWEDIKEDVMYEALELKAVYNPAFVEDLLASGSRHLVENSPSDYYWGIGYLKTGKNRLGHLLMELRDQIRDKEQWEKFVRDRTSLKPKEGEKEKMEHDDVYDRDKVIRTKKEWDKHVMMLATASIIADDDDDDKTLK